MKKLKQIEMKGKRNKNWEASLIRTYTQVLYSTLLNVLFFTYLYYFFIRPKIIIIMGGTLNMPAWWCVPVC